MWHINIDWFHKVTSLLAFSEEYIPKICARERAAFTLEPNNYLYLPGYVK